MSTEIATRCVRELRHRGYESVVTSALALAGATAFLDAGFVVRERLDLFEHTMEALPAPELPCGRMRRADQPSVLMVDRLAFTDAWRLDADGLGDAIAATPITRARIARDPDVIAYAITGRAGRQGYLQRVAVHPNVRRQGWGRSLVADALAWLDRHAIARTVVNTQVDNAPAQSLYRSCGFELLPVGLCVLGRDL